ncbi:zona pellucida sperm-binding protein 2 [Rhinatrema bivittatum]|uniref:zona pellucida sperm-binding protein 2 n=1 Tax=Rhinatrema bivittatum TaxID=194408 RepID=UPI0011275241|nr:zona pellucida sperm-binding protein 2 [Rhinatrema bivittatum]
MGSLLGGARALVGHFLSRARCFCILGWLAIALAGAASDLPSSFAGTVSCREDGLVLQLPEQPGNHSWRGLYIIGSAGEEIMDCNYILDSEKLILIAAFENCTELEHGRHHLKIKLLSNETSTGYKNETYDIFCEDLQADQNLHGVRVGAVNCSRDSMTVAFPRSFPALDSEVYARTLPTWILEVKNSTRVSTFTTAQARKQGYRFVVSGDSIVLQASLNASGIGTFQQGSQKLYMAELKLIYIIGSQKITFEAQTICAPESVACNKTHLTVTVPRFPGALLTITVGTTDIPVTSLQETKDGSKIYMETSILKEDAQCVSAQFYTASLQLTFLVNDKMVPVLTRPECPCRNLPAPPDVVCTAEGYMDFEITADSTRPELNLDTVKLKDPNCQPISKSKEKVRFHVPLSGCGTKRRFEGETAIYENEVWSQWVDLPPSRISRDSEFRLTVLCYYQKDNITINLDVMTRSPPVLVSKSEGPLSLVLNLYSGDLYEELYTDQQYPVVKHLREPLYLEARLLNRNDPNLELMLNDCWATALEDPASVPRWNIVVDGCDFENDNYKTVFHPVGFKVDLPSYRKRFEVKTFAFVSGDKVLSSLVYFHCSVIVCNVLEPDSPLCSKTCSTSQRKKREAGRSGEGYTLSLPGPVLLVGSGQSKNRESMKAAAQRTLQGGTWPILTMTLLIFVVLPLTV